MVIPSFPDQVISFILLLFVIAIYMVLSYEKITIFEPTKLFLLPWIIIFIFLSAGFITYEKIYSGITIALIISVIFSFIFGAITYKLQKKSIQKTNLLLAKSSTLTISKYYMAVLILFSLIYSVYQFIELAKIISIGGLGGTSLAELRLAHWERFWEQDITLSRIGVSVSRIFAILFSVLISYFLINKKLGMLLISLFVWLALVGESFLHGGRFLIIYLFCTSIYIYFFLKKYSFNHVRTHYSNNIKPLRVAAFTIVGMALFYGSFVTYQNLRNPVAIENIDVFIAKKHESQLSGWVNELEKKNGFNWLPAFSYGTSYLSLPIVKLTFFIEKGEVDGWYKMGYYNFPILSKIVSFSTGNKNEWISIRGEIANISRSYGYTENPWATGIRDLLIDFGPVGTVIFTFILGYVSQFVFYRALHSNHMDWTLLLSFVGSSCLIFAFLSPLLIGYVSNSIMLCVALIFLRKIKM